MSGTRRKLVMFYRDTERKKITIKVGRIPVDEADRRAHSKEIRRKLDEALGPKVSRDIGFKFI